VPYTTGTVSLEFFTTEGTRHTNGTVLIVRSVSAIRDSTGHAVLSGSVSVKIPKDATGPITQALPATDDATLDPSGFMYTIIPPKAWAVPSVSGVSLNGGQTRHFADLVTVEPAPVVPASPVSTPSSQGSSRASTRPKMTSTRCSRARRVWLADSPRSRR
jgi:hypothetical protein